MHPSMEGSKCKGDEALETKVGQKEQGEEEKAIREVRGGLVNYHTCK